MCVLVGDCVFWLVMACFGVSWSTLVALDMGVYDGLGKLLEVECIDEEEECWSPKLSNQEPIRRFKSQLSTFFGPSTSPSSAIVVFLGATLSI